MHHASRNGTVKIPTASSTLEKQCTRFVLLSTCDPTVPIPKRLVQPNRNTMWARAKGCMWRMQTDRGAHNVPHTLLLFIHQNARSVAPKMYTTCQHTQRRRRRRRPQHIAAPKSYVRLGLDNHLANDDERAKCVDAHQPLGAMHGMKSLSIQVSAATVNLNPFIKHLRHQLGSSAHQIWLAPENQKITKCNESNDFPVGATITRLRY